VEHVGGLLDKGKLAFPNATLYISKQNATFWLDSASRKTAPECTMQFFDPAVTAITPYLKVSKVKTLIKVIRSSWE